MGAKADSCSARRNFAEGKNFVAERSLRAGLIHVATVVIQSTAVRSGAAGFFEIAWSKLSEQVVGEIAGLRDEHRAVDASSKSIGDKVNSSATDDQNDAFPGHIRVVRQSSSDQQ